MKIDERGCPEKFWRSIEKELGAAASLEAASQIFCDRFYETYRDSTSLVRVFAALPAEQLSAGDREFAQAFATRAGLPQTAGGAETVLTLLGTRGIEPAWCGRERSTGHRAIPLVSDEFVEEIPMIARLLGEVGYGPIKARPSDWQFVTRGTGDSNGLFFVGDARTTTDARGRRIIPAVEFVERYRIKTVFGFGGAYASGDGFLAVIAFCHQVVARADAARFLTLSGFLKASTSELFAQQKVYSGR